ncbi:hypothetical protein [Dysgonomonas capnocytophagoides]|uniref:hypothetical protein n=1 Tax=Dysgonomonas capnocytophagoides TaxID=45254 RepID=UPI002921EF4F|nr:hypothetical protein DCPSUM001_14340 [Dysgonomonas capnocytophagoides]
MKRQQFYLLLFIFSVGTLQMNSQVGIGTKLPQQVLHIDGNSDTSGISNTTDDVVIDQSGNIGIGLTVPSAKLDIKYESGTPVPSFRLDDGKAQPNYILMSDANGYGTWKVLPEMGASLIWKISNTAFYLSTSLSKFTGITTVNGDLPGFVANTASSTLLVPKGKYIISFYGDLNGWEYLKLQVYGTNLSTPTGYLLTSFNYRSYLNSTSDFWDIEEDTTIYFRVQGYDGRNVFWSQTSGFVNGIFSMYYQITFLKVA